MKAIRNFIIAADRVLGILEEILLASLVAAITSVTFLQVFTRYVTEDPFIWTEELARYLFVWIALIGGAAAVRTNGHFGLDVLRRHIPAVRVALGLVTMVIVAIFL